MPDIVVAKPFTLTLAPNDVRSFAPGIHKDVPAEVAEHWFAQPHMAKEGQVLEPELASPLTHEERVSMKAAIDAAETRAQAAQEERDRIKGGFSKLTDENITLKARIAELEKDLEAATKPPTPSGGAPKK